MTLMTLTFHKSSTFKGLGMMEVDLVMVHHPFPLSFVIPGSESGGVFYFSPKWKSACSEDVELSQLINYIKSITDSLHI